MIDPIWLKAVAKTLVLPPTGLLLLALAGLSMRRRFPRTGSFAAWTGVLVLLLLSIPTVAGLLVRSLDTSPVFDPAQASSAQAIVVLGGGTRRNAPEYGGDTLGELTLERVRYGAAVARMTGLPILVSGGSVLGGETEAKLMREALEREFGIPVRWVEQRSRTTHENALRSRGDPAPGRRAACRSRGTQLRHAAREGGVRGGRHRDFSGADRHSQFRP